MISLFPMWIWDVLTMAVSEHHTKSLCTMWGDFRKRSQVTLRRRSRGGADSIFNGHNEENCKTIDIPIEQQMWNSWNESESWNVCVHRSAEIVAVCWRVKRAACEVYPELGRSRLFPVSLLSEKQSWPDKQKPSMLQLRRETRLLVLCSAFSTTHSRRSGRAAFHFGCPANLNSECYVSWCVWIWQTCARCLFIF